MLHAVIVGIDDYKDPLIPPLSHAQADAETLAGLLRRRVRQEDLSVRLLVNDQATNRNITAAIGEDLHRAVERDDVVLLYFACHGSPERRAPKDRRSHYLIPNDTEYGRIFTTGIDMERDIARWLERLEDAKLVVLFLDACFSGVAGGRSFVGPVLAANPTLDKYLERTEAISIRGLKLGRGRVIICAADSDQVALEDTALGHGVFTYHLLESLQRDRGAATTVDLVDLYKEVEQRVRLATNNAQEPVLSVIQGAHPRLPSLG